MVRPTLEDVARFAGVSRATVSRVVRHDAGVATETAAKVGAAVSKLGYVPNASARSLGTASALHEIGFAREHGIRYYHLGYWVAGSPTMDYKAKYRPHEVLDPDGVWRPRS